MLTLLAAVSIALPMNARVRFHVPTLARITALAEDKLAARQQKAKAQPKGTVEVTFPQKGNKVIQAKQGEPLGKVVSRAGLRVKFDCKVRRHVRSTPRARMAHAPALAARAEWAVRNLPGAAQRPRGRENLPGRDGTRRARCRLRRELLAQ